MLRVQPTELITMDSEHYVVRCQTFDDRGVVEFVFAAELNDSDIGDRRQIKHQDAFFFITHDDDGGWSLLKAVVQFDKFRATNSDTIRVASRLPSPDFQPTELRSVEDSIDKRSYEIVFASNVESVKRQFVVGGSGDKRSVSFENQTWTAGLNGLWWTLEGRAAEESPIILALIYFDWARNFEYTNAQLKERSEKILWDTIFLQSEKNDEKRRQLPTQKTSP